MNKYFFSALIASIALATSTFAESSSIGVVNFTTCVTDSKSGKKEQENMENIRKQMASLIEDAEKELKELTAKFEDTEFMDSLSPKKEEELKVRYQTLQEDMGRYQGQYYQVLQHAQYQLVQKVNSNIAKAAESVAKTHNFDYVINKEACFYIRSDLDVTSDVIHEMDKAFDSMQKTKNPSDSAKNLSDNLEPFELDDNQVMGY